MIWEFIRTEHYNATGAALLNASKLLDPRKQGSVHKLIMGSNIAYSMLRNQLKNHIISIFPTTSVIRLYRGDRVSDPWRNHICYVIDDVRLTLFHIPCRGTYLKLGSNHKQNRRSAID